MTIEGVPIVTKCLPLVTCQWVDKWNMMLEAYFHLFYSLIVGSL